MTRDQVFQSKYLSKDDVKTPITATIDCVRMDEINGEDNSKESKPVIHWADDQVKPMILNNTNWTLLEVMHGPDSDAWVGKKVECYNDPTVAYMGKLTGGVRVRAPSKNGDTPGLWTLDKAVQQAGTVGIKKEEIIAAIKAKGNSGWVANRDTPLVQEMIANKGNEEIPFD